MKWFEGKKKTKPRAPLVQVRRSESHPFGELDRYIPLKGGEERLYRAIREGVPIVDAALWKLIRLCGGVIKVQLLLVLMWRTTFTLMIY